MKRSTKYLLSLLLLAVCFPLTAQQPLSKGDIIVKTSKSPHPGRVVLKGIENLREDTVVIRIINTCEKKGKREAIKELKPKEAADWDVTFTQMRARLKKSKDEIEIFNYKDGASQKVDTVPVTPNEEIISGFNTHLNSIVFLSDSTMSADSLAVARHLSNLGLPSIDKQAYIADESLDKYVAQYRDSLNKYSADSLQVIDSYIAMLGPKTVGDAERNSLLSLYRGRIDRKGAVIAPLSKILEESKNSKPSHFDNKFFIVCGSVVLLCILLALWFWRVNKKSPKKKKTPAEDTTVSSGSDTPSLVVMGTKTPTTLKKQSLDDVHDNESYIKIDAADFCEDSIVSTIYIKNSCIKEIYNMYAEDLRQPDHPKEDGCMVIGRWVQDEKTGRYEVSLEHTVMPGDDAVFAEYELNFGGKIKLRMSERLRKLRRETGLQYDLTCWVHSHPGLGVFFSNSDNNVQHQLKHPTHPGFLTAIVVDILTPKQDMGIFTFKDTETVNSKGDLKRMYSLEELYNQALQNERSSFDSNDYFDVLSDADSHLDACYGIQLSNSAIIDMTFLTSKPNGFIGFAHGYTIKRGERTQCVVSVVNANQSSPNTDRLGCFVIASHCSIPSIRKAVAPYLRDIHFVLVYTASNGLLTAIPVIDRDLTASDEYYGEHELENLKIWTRRRR